MTLPYYCCYSLGLNSIRRGRWQEGRDYLTLGLDYLQLNHARRLEEWLGPPQIYEDLREDRKEAALGLHAERKARAETGSLWDMDRELVEHMVSGGPFGDVYLNPKYHHKVEPLLSAMLVAHYAMSFPVEQRFTALSRLQTRFPKESPITTAVGYAMDYCTDVVENPDREPPKWKLEEERRRLAIQPELAGQAERMAARMFQMYVERGDAEVKAGKKDVALASYRGAIEADPDNPMVSECEAKIAQILSQR